MSIALVTGTNTGIGLATAVELARSGHTVFAGMRKLERGAELNEIATTEKLPVEPLQLDVDSDKSVEQAIAHILARQGRIDVLVNNAGISAGGPVEEVPIAVFRQLMETNFFGGLRCIKAVLPGMRARRSGCIVNVPSVAGRLCGAVQGPYAASKWACEALSECLAREMRAFKVRVAIIEPGVIATRMTTTRHSPKAESPYAHRRRLGAYVAAALRNPISPFVVAEQIRDIVNSDSLQLRHPSGPDAALLIEWRRSKSDEEWIALGAASDDQLLAEAKHHLNMDI